jgi:5-methylcytosine-specific restriction endonuclease McrA
MSKINFYYTKAWLAVRREVFATYEHRCMRCSAENLPLQVDHIKPRSRFPELELELTNLQLLCRKCNMIKWDKDFTDYRPYANQKKYSKLIGDKIFKHDNF